MLSHSKLWAAGVTLITVPSVFLFANAITILPYLKGDGLHLTLIWEITDIAGAAEHARRENQQLIGVHVMSENPSEDRNPPTARLGMLVATGSGVRW